MFNFSREYSTWPLKGNEELNIVYLETRGSNLEEMLDNAIMVLEDWHGNPGPEWSVGDLSTIDYDQVMNEFMDYINERT